MESRLILADILKRSNLLTRIGHLGLHRTQPLGHLSPERRNIKSSTGDFIFKVASHAIDFVGAGPGLLESFTINTV
jgi:hypothetical protein